MLTSLVSPLVRNPISSLIPSTFTPRSISKLVYWFDGNLSPTVAGAAPNQISRWDDISGNGFFANQPSSSQQAFTGLNTLNGKNVITFSNDNLILPTATTLGIVNVDYEMVFVARSSSSAIQFLISGANTENYEMHLNLSPFGSAGLRFIPTATKFSDIGSEDDFSDGVGHILGGRVASNIGIARADRVDSLDTETPARSSNTTVLRFGLRSDGFSFPLFGDMALALLFQPALTVPERSDIDNYIFQQWAV